MTNQADYTPNRFTIADVMTKLDEADRYDCYNQFFNLEHPYFYTAGSAMTLFADDTRWAFVFEKSGYSQQSGYPQIELTYFGNCLHSLDKAGHIGQFTHNAKYLPLIDFELSQQLIDEADDYNLIKREIECVTIRGQQVVINQNPDDYEGSGIRLRDYENPNRLTDYCSLVRYWADNQADKLLAMEDELRTCIPENLPKLMRIDAWYHQSYSVEHNLGVKPSDYETYPMMADVLVKGDPACWKPTLSPNNAWRNWPQAGSL